MATGATARRKSLSLIKQTRAASPWSLGNISLNAIPSRHARLTKSTSADAHVILTASRCQGDPSSDTARVFKAVGHVDRALQLAVLT